MVAPAKKRSRHRAAVIGVPRGMRLAFDWIRRRPAIGNDPCRPQTMLDKLVAATIGRVQHLLQNMYID